MKHAPGRAAMTAALLVVAAGCGGGAGPSDPPEERVRATVAQLEKALRDRELDRVCEELLSPEARRRAGGEECPRRLARSTAAVADPSIEVVRVTFAGGGATAQVRAPGEDGRPALDSIRLVPGEGGYRVDALSRG